MKRLAYFAAAALIVAPGLALAWGSTGHRIVGQAAMQALPPEVPAFLRTAETAVEVGELSRELDRSKGAGKIHDTSRDPAHFVDVDDEGRVFGGPPLAELPPTRAEYETALRAVGEHSWKAGWLPYAMVDRWQQLAKDFAYWRVLSAAEANPAWREHHAWFAADRRRREHLILQTIGELSHLTADGSQPLHVSVHYNGWGDYPNPQGYTRAKLHGPFEGELVRADVEPAAVSDRMRPLDVPDQSIERRVAAYLGATHELVEPFYDLEKAGGLLPGDPRGPDFATRRLAVGASELRDLIVKAWRASEHRTVGWRPVSVADVVAGKVDPYPALYGVD